MQITFRARRAGWALLGLCLLIHAGAAAAGLYAGQVVKSRNEIVLRVEPNPASAVLETVAAHKPVQLVKSLTNDYGLWWLAESGKGSSGWLLEKAAPGAPTTTPASTDGTAPAAATRPAVTMAPITPPADPALADDRSADYNKLWAAIQDGSTMEARMHACQLLPYSGLADERFFDALNEWLERRYQQASMYDQDVEADVTRCLQGLASSGNAKYLPMLDKWAQSEQMGHAGRKMIIRSKVLLASSSAWNPQINRIENHTAGRSWASTRVMNMIQAPDPALQRQGLRRITHHPKQYADVFPAVEARLLATYKTALDPMQEDTAAWFCKTLGASRNPQYEETLRKIAADGPSPKVRSYADDGLDALHSEPEAETEEVEEVE